MERKVRGSSLSPGRASDSESLEKLDTKTRSGARAGEGISHLPQAGSEREGKRSVFFGLLQPWRELREPERPEGGAQGSGRDPAFVSHPCPGDGGWG